MALIMSFTSLLHALLLSSTALTAVVSQVTLLGDHYRNGYPADQWNYDYSQSIEDGTCGLNNVCSVESRCGPKCWSLVVPSDSSVTNVCGGSAQTPVNLVQAEVDDTLEHPVFSVTNDGCASWVQYANDHAFKVSFSEAGCSNMQLTYDGILYTLLQFHFHVASEHAVAGGIADAELHMVHASDDGDLLVLGVMMNAGLAPNEVLRSFFTAAEEGTAGSVLEGSESVYSKEYSVSTTFAPLLSRVNMYEAFLPAHRDFITYSGSLTTYPCTEGVRWIVYEQPVRIGESDLTKLRNAVINENNTITLADNGYAVAHAANRPLQPLNDRVLKRYQDGISSISTASLNTDSTSSSNKGKDDDDGDDKIDRALALGAVGAVFGIVGFCIAVVLSIFLIPAILTTISTGQKNDSNDSNAAQDKTASKHGSNNKVDEEASIASELA